MVIITGDRIKTQARGDRVCRIVLCSSGHGCDRVIVDCDGGTLSRLRVKRQEGDVFLTGGWGRGVGYVVSVRGVAK